MNDFECNCHCNGCPCCDCGNADNLDYKKSEAAAVENAVDTVKQTDCKCAEHTVYAVNTDCTDGIVDMKLEVKELNRNNNKDTCDKADNRRSEAVNICTAGSYGNKACK